MSFPPSIDPALCSNVRDRGRGGSRTAPTHPRWNTGRESIAGADVADGKISGKTEVMNPGHEPGAIPAFLYQKGVECIVAGGMGMRATSFFAEYGIKTVVGISGKIDEVLEKIAKNELEGGESLCSPGAGKGYGQDGE